MTSNSDEIKPKRLWCDLEITFTPTDVLETCRRIEKEIFSLDAKGSQANLQRNARANGALIEFTNLQAKDRARMLGVNENSVWYLGRKWHEVESSVRHKWLKCIHDRLQK